MEVPELTDRSVKSIGDSLREFGYTSLTDDEVRRTANQLLRGIDMSESDVIALFIRRMLREAGMLPDES